MRKGGQHKPLILDKFSAEDLKTSKDITPEQKKLSTCSVPAPMQSGAGRRGTSNPLRGEEQQVMQ